MRLLEDDFLMPRPSALAAMGCREGSVDASPAAAQLGASASDTACAAPSQSRSASQGCWSGVCGCAPSGYSSSRCPYCWDANNGAAELPDVCDERLTADSLPMPDAQMLDKIDMPAWPLQ